MIIEWCKKVYSDDRHNAFTGLTRYQGKYYLAFRSGTGHADNQSEQIIMVSDNGEDWAVVNKRRFVGTAGATVDYRDSYFLPHKDKLLLYSFCTPVVGGVMQIPYSQVQMIQSDSRTWPEPRTIHEDSVLWKPYVLENRFYAVGYKTSWHPRKNLTDFFQSDDGMKWEKVVSLATGSEGSEACLHSPGRNRLTAFIRTEIPPYHLAIFESKKPFAEWNKITEVPQIIQCPHVIEFGGKVLVIGRYRTEYMKKGDKNSHSDTKIWEFKDYRFSEVLELPSMGDNAYAGTSLMPDGSLLVSYYSQADVAGNADIFVAKINP